MKREGLRNIAIIAHVDHGKTTLVDAMLKFCGTFRKNQEVAERVMDSNDLEKERGITILAKNTSVVYDGVKINIIDTPGHADFGGEVERVLKMIDGVLLLVDAAEGTMPQTRFVLKNALESGLKILIVINKVDRADARVKEAEEEVMELLLDLGAGEDALNFPVVYASGRNGTADFTSDGKSCDLRPLFDAIVKHIPAPDAEIDKPFQMLVSAVDYNEYVGRIGIGKIERGVCVAGKEYAVLDYLEKTPMYKSKISTLYQIENLKRVPVESATAGDIVCVAGMENINIGNTVCDTECLEVLPFANVSEPTLEMQFLVNNSPFAGREGKFVTSRNLRERLYRELLKDVSLRVTDGDTRDTFLVAGRGEIHLSILIENMRREGYEFMVGSPKVMYKTVDGVKCEPIEHVIIDIPETSVGSVMEKLGTRRGELLNMFSTSSRTRIEFLVPSRGLLGYRNEFLTDTKGEGVLNTLFHGYQPYKGDIRGRSNGSLIAYETGETTAYGLFNAEERGVLFVSPGTQVYQGMVVGYAPKIGDLVVNVCKKKHVSNMRASGSDEALRLSTPKTLSLEEAIEFLESNEFLEVTPKSMRIRKRILEHTERGRDDVLTGYVKK